MAVDREQKRLDQTHKNLQKQKNPKKFLLFAI
jgi:hypothetical protein